MIVGVDVGNTAIKWTTDDDGVSEDDAIRYVRLTNPRAIEQVSDDIGRACVGKGFVSVRIASVNRVAATSLVSRLKVIDPSRMVPHLVTRDDLPMELAVDFPERVGIDRLVGAYGASSGNSDAILVVDAGTTVTVDLVDAAGVFQGGAILPGLAMQMSALASGTDALPRIDWRSCECGDGPVVPGKNTEAAIRLGILSSVAGGIERLSRLYGHPGTVVVTGGDAACVSAALSLPHRVEEQLVCRTLLKLPLDH